jgi:hypothetical protein
MKEISMTEDVKTPEQIAADAEAAAQAAAAAAAAAAAQAAADKKAAKDAEKAAKAAAKEADKKAKADKKAADAAAKLEAKAKADAEKAEKAAAKAASKPAKVVMPEQNGVRRPKPEGLCGQVWTLADNISRQMGQPVPIATLLEASKAAGLNEGNVRAEYARWRKFNGVSGRVVAPVTIPAVPQAADPAAGADPAAAAA